MTVASYRVWLDPLTPEHADGLFLGLSDPAGYAYLPGDPPGDVEALRTRFRRFAAGRSVDGSELWFNWAIRREAAFVGTTQATVAGDVALVAYQVFPSCWRQGVGRTGLAATLELVFAMPLVALARALVDTRNQASAALLGSLGFEAVRRIEHADFFKGSASDETQFELSRAAWVSGPNRVVAPG